MVRRTLADGATFQEVASAWGSRHRDIGLRKLSGARAALLALFSVVTLFAHRRKTEGRAYVRALGTAGTSDVHRCSSVGAQGAVDAGGDFLRVALQRQTTVKVPREFVERLTDAFATRVNGQSPAKRLSE